MKIYIKIFSILIALFFLALTGCEEKVLDKKPRDVFAETDIWVDPALAKMYVWGTYNALGSFYSPYAPDLGVFTRQWTYAYTSMGFRKATAYWNYNNGSLTPDNSHQSDNWRINYYSISRVNQFLNRIDEVPGIDEDERNRLKGEMRFLRAWSYGKLIDYFGGVPIITKVFNLNDDYDVERDSYQDVVNFIIQELNEVEGMVPETLPPNETGRISKGAVLAFKSRLLLYAASELHDPGTAPINGQSGPLFDYDKNTKWQDAADAAKAVIDMNQYSLVEVENWKDYQQMFLETNSEQILVKMDHPQHTHERTNHMQYNLPNGYHGWANNMPTHNFAQDFQMKDGKSIEESDLYNPAPDLIYENRELRFYANIIYQGSEFLGRKLEFWFGGLDSSDGPEGWNWARTRYSMRKFMDESLDFTLAHPTPVFSFMRLAEIYLNYAEAQYHLGNEELAREYVNKIRNRAQLPDINSTGVELLEDIRHERKIELCFEGHYFSDIRRWMTAEVDAAEDVEAIEWTKNGDDMTYNVIIYQERMFDKAYYYLPIPRDEIEKSNLQQNPGYN